MKRKNILVISVIIIFIIFLIVFLFQQKRKKDNGIKENIVTNIQSELEFDENKILETENNEDNGILVSTDDISLKDIDGKQTNYSFVYKGEAFNATYTKDNWHIEDSYKIRNKEDMAIICQALTNIHKIHGKDMSSYRTIDDLVYEWEQHNIAYDVLPEDSIWKESAKNVDLDPEDQGRSIQEIYEARTGKKFNLEDIIKENIKK